MHKYLFQTKYNITDLRYNHPARMPHGTPSLLSSRVHRLTSSFRIVKSAKRIPLSGSLSFGKKSKSAGGGGRGLKYPANTVGVRGVLVRIPPQERRPVCIAGHFLRISGRNFPTGTHFAVFAGSSLPIG